MKTDKQVKKEFKIETSKDPDRFYAIQSLKKEGFNRNKCTNCKTYFWAIDKQRKICGDSSCVGGFDIVNDNPAKNKLSYIDVWNTFKKHFKQKKYKPIDRYPVVARWNPTVDFTIASIAAFQPFVVSGEVDPPAKRLVIPQFCLRFGDVDNVGVTGSHCTGFVMIGQHQFVNEDEWDIEQSFMDVYSYLLEVVGLSKEELILHEDVWAGGGNFGPCMEFFSRGIELFNQVYMMFEQTPEGGRKELQIKVLDMGLGMERIAWFTQGTTNIYEAIFPKTLEKVRRRINVDYDFELFKKFSHYSGLLNADEVDDVGSVWDDIAKSLKQKSGKELKEKIMPMTAVYSIVEHSRSLLVALNDGMLPSNVGGGYNLRVILRRALSFIEKNNWPITLQELTKWHAQELKKMYPELLENITNVNKIIDVEVEKYKITKDKAKQIVKKLIKKKDDINTKKLIELYDNNGVNPEMFKEAAEQVGRKISIPNNFYSLVAEMQEERSRKEKESNRSEQDNCHKISEDLLKKIPETRVSYYQDWSITNFSSKILFIEGDKIILEETYFYPKSGGQSHDDGTINGIEVSHLDRQGKHVVHILKSDEKSKILKVGDKVKCEINFEQRKQLTQHHTSAHIINAAARVVLGDHVNQAGAQKKVEKAHLDITHYHGLTGNEIKKIEKEANKIVKQSVPVNSIFMPRTEAEIKYSVRIYQGGVAPGKILRIVEIPGVETEACGGTHLRNTNEAEKIIITSANKISDGIIRLNYVAGKAADNLLNKESLLLEKIAKILACEKEKVPVMAETLFKLWKSAKKSIKKKEIINLDLKIDTKNSSDDLKLSEKELLEKTANVFSTQVEHIPKTATRFLNDIEKFKKKMTEMVK